jgi:hypothetical protein
VREVAERIIDHLDSLEGFDHWWHDIDPDVQEGIIDSIALILTRGES